MTNEDIIRMAREAGLVMYDYSDPSLERFANLVAAEEREACAQIAFSANTYLEAAAAIRAREKNNG
jgi:homoserine acetyltransferase